MKRTLIFLGSILTAAVLFSCTPYAVTTPLEKQLKEPKTCAIGLFTDELPADMKPSAKPTVEEIDNLKDEIDYQLNKSDIFDMIDLSSGPSYELSGEVLEFRRGSGAVRFLIGFGAGDAKIVVALKLRDLADSSNVVFAGNFKATVSDWTLKGEEMYKIIAKNFVKALKKQIKNAEKANVGG